MCDGPGYNGARIEGITVRRYDGRRCDNCKACGPWNLRTKMRYTISATLYKG